MGFQALFTLQHNKNHKQLLESIIWGALGAPKAVGGPQVPPRDPWDQ